MPLTAPRQWQSMAVYQTTCREEHCQLCLFDSTMHSDGFIGVLEREKPTFPTSAMVTLHYLLYKISKFAAVAALIWIYT
jgi:hypothetical protein